MKVLGVIFILAYAFHLQITNTVFGQTSEAPQFNDSVLSNDSFYCFEFTWLGPQYDNFSNYPADANCGDVLDNSRAGNDIPCRNPLVITFDGTPPDIDYLWQHYRNSVLCRRTDKAVCAKYSFKYDGELYNSTYMCTKSRSMTSGSVVDSGCFKEMKDGFEIETCICKSNPGYRYKPCNSVGQIFIQKSLIISSLLTLLYYKYSF